MKKEYDLSKLEWTLAGYMPNLWKFEKIYKGGIKTVDVGPLKAKVPGSVQTSLLEAGVIEDWHFGFKARNCEWIENRHWAFETMIPDEWMNEKLNFRLHCMGLDYSGWIYVNGHEVSTFKGTHVPHVFDITEYLKESGNTIEIIFDMPPRWLGQFGYTSQMTEWKTRFNYSWDWVPRLVQIGIWDSILLVASNRNCFEEFRCYTDLDIENHSGELRILGSEEGTGAFKLRCTLSKGGSAICESDFPAALLKKGIVWEKLPVEPWWPNLEGLQPLYDFNCELCNEEGEILDSISRRVGFRNIKWDPCPGAPPEADPWICVVNGKRIFLQGVNFAPIRANFADLTKEDYAKRLRVYRDIGCNMLRINACGFLEFECFYDLCDELGIMVWQEFPLTSSGIENWPPEDDNSILALSDIAQSFIKRRQHHVSLTMWGGGNELQGDPDGNKTGIGKPCDLSHPMLSRLKKIVEVFDPTRRYIHTSPSGPRAGASEADFGKGLHWDVHGPYENFDSIEKALKYWEHDDALFRSELCCSGANPAEITRHYAGNCKDFPATACNSYWSNPTAWWNDWDQLVNLYGREPESLEEYVEWSQKKQADTLTFEMNYCKKRFPYCGGVLLWGSHDTFPIPINTTIIDFNGDPKPAAIALAKVWKNKYAKES